MSASTPISLKDITIPEQVHIQVAQDFENLFANIGRRSAMGFSGNSFFGCAFLQGNRLQFTTAMTVERMLVISQAVRSSKRDTVEKVMEKSNRPAEPKHSKELREYLRKTACAGDKFILPAFTFNYGVGLTEDAPRATLLLFSGEDDDGNTSWPAMLLLPAGAILDTTDGAHRRSQIEILLTDKKVTQEEKVALKMNSVDTKIVFDPNRTDVHQDFADCGRARPIAASIIAAFDVRDGRNLLARNLVKTMPFLNEYVDATASNVNLSRQSSKIWSLSAVRNFVSYVLDSMEAEAEPLNEKAQVWFLTEFRGFFNALIELLPMFQDLKHHRQTTGQLRDVRGGNIALRGVGMALFSRAFLHCHKHGIAYSKMAEALAPIDWHLLKIDRAQLPSDTPWSDAIRDNANRMWIDLLAISEGAFRIRSPSPMVTDAWHKILDEIAPTLTARAAAE